MYQQRGPVPRKRHTQAWRDGRLLTEEVIGREGFAGAESILYHLNSPCRIVGVGAFEPIGREAWVPDAHHHHLFDSSGLAPAGDAVTGRRLLLWNDDLEVWLARPSRSMDRLYRNGEGDELVFVHEGSGVLETIVGDLPYREGDYIVVPRGITYRFRHDGDAPQRHLVLTTPGPVAVPTRYRNEYGQLQEHAPYSNRDLHPPAELRTHDERGEFELTVRVRGGLQTYVVDHHPFDVVAWDGYLYPWTLSIHDFEPVVKAIHAPPPVHQTFAGDRFVVCSFCPRPLDFHPDAVPIPYNHANVDSEELIYYVSGDFSSREGIGAAALTLHPSGVPHGPQPGLAERSLQSTHTSEVAVMVDAFRPVTLAALGRDLDRPGYVYSWSGRPVGDRGPTPTPPG